MKFPSFSVDYVVLFVFVVIVVVLGPLKLGGWLYISGTWGAMV